MGMAWTVRPFGIADAQAMSGLILRTLREVLVRDYEPALLDLPAAGMSLVDVIPSLPLTVPG